jgi:hypothetical protein
MVKKYKYLIKKINNKILKYNKVYDNNYNLDKFKLKVIMHKIKISQLRL